MHTNGTASPHTLVGRVDAVRPTGILVDGTWASLSKFRPLALPAVGALVQVEVDPKGFIVRLDDVRQLPSDVSPIDPYRLEALTAAIAFASTREAMRLADVLTAADRMLEWLERSDEHARGHEQ